MIFRPSTGCTSGPRIRLKLKESPPDELSYTTFDNNSLSPHLNYLTSYGYDVLDDLTTVTQGSQQRYFMYDSLKRLVRAKNPEQSSNSALNLTDTITGNSSWSMGYQYDNAGNLTQKT